MWRARLLGEDSIGYRVPPGVLVGAVLATVPARGIFQGDDLFRLFPLCNSSQEFNLPCTDEAGRERHRSAAAAARRRARAPAPF